MDRLRERVEYAGINKRQADVIADGTAGQPGLVLKGDIIITVLFDIIKGMDPFLRMKCI